MTKGTESIQLVATSTISRSSGSYSSQNLTSPSSPHETILLSDTLRLLMEPLCPCNTLIHVIEYKSHSLIVESLNVNNSQCCLPRCLRDRHLRRGRVELSPVEFQSHYSFAVSLDAGFASQAVFVPEAHLAIERPGDDQIPSHL